ncbi:MAG: hypothetical protein KAQ83_03955, partial [Nanoarchaeota archaeon]|nr:hypothetical protein [Nanoarchaeota archaeon]
SLPAGVLLGEGGYPVGHIEGSYYEYFVFNESNPYLYPDDSGRSDPGEQYEIKRIYKISFEVDPKDIAGSDTIDLKFTVDGQPLDLDLTNETITNTHEIDVDGDSFAMKGETVMIRNSTYTGSIWKMQTGIQGNNPIWTTVEDTTEFCIEFSLKEDLNPEFSSYLYEGNKVCNTFVAEYNGINDGDLFGGLPNPWTT